MLLIFWQLLLLGFGEGLVFPSNWCICLTQALVDRSEAGAKKRKKQTRISSSPKTRGKAQWAGTWHSRNSVVSVGSWQREGGKDEEGNHFYLLTWSLDVENSKKEATSTCQLWWWARLFFCSISPQLASAFSCVHGHPDSNWTASPLWQWHQRLLQEKQKIIWNCLCSSLSHKPLGWMHNENVKTDIQKD